MPVIKGLIEKIEVTAREKYDFYDSDKSIKMLEWFLQKFFLLNRATINKKQLVYRGEIYWCDLGENVGSEESKRRPCVIIQNQKGNEVAPTTLVAPITNATINLPIAVRLDRGPDSPVTGTVDLGQIRVVAKGRLFQKIDSLSTSELKQVDKAILSSLGLYRYYINQQNNDLKIRELTNELRQCKALLAQ